MPALSKKASLTTRVSYNLSNCDHRLESFAQTGGAQTGGQHAICSLSLYFLLPFVSLCHELICGIDRVEVMAARTTQCGTPAKLCSICDVKQAEKLARSLEGIFVESLWTF